MIPAEPAPLDAEGLRITPSSLQRPPAASRPSQKPQAPPAGSSS